MNNKARIYFGWMNKVIWVGGPLARSGRWQETGRWPLAGGGPLALPSAMFGARPVPAGAHIIPISQYLDEYQVKSFGIPEKTG